MLVCVNKRARQDGGGGGCGGACVSPVHEKVAAPLLRGGSEGVQIPFTMPLSALTYGCFWSDRCCLSFFASFPSIHESPALSLWLFILLPSFPFFSLSDTLKYIGNLCLFFLLSRSSEFKFSFIILLRGLTSVCSVSRAPSKLDSHHANMYVVMGYYLSSNFIKNRTWNVRRREAHNSRHCQEAYKWIVEE